MNCRTPLVSNTFGTNVVSTFAYAYDELSRRTQRLDTTDSALTTNTFSYNVRSELIDATMGTNTYSYAYDPIGNRQQTVENGLTNLYTANALNQYTAIAPDTPALAYDPDGNMTRNGDWTYIWDAENRLVEARPATTNLGSSLVQYMYDAQSRRIARRKFAWNDYLGETTWHYVQGRAFLYDDWNLLEERKPAIAPRTPHPYISQTNLSLTGIGGPVAAACIWGLDLSSSLHDAGGIGGLLMQHHSDYTSPWFSFCDANGNITDLLDEVGSLAAHYEYDSYGNTTVQSGTPSAANPFRFSSKYCDQETGHCYFGCRFYLPSLSRWCQRDPLEESGGTGLYLFVDNSPVDIIDPWGLSRMLTGARVEYRYSSGGKDARDVMRYLEEMKTMTDKEGNFCFVVEIRDLVTSSLDSIESELRVNGDNVFFIGHGGLMVNGRLFDNKRDGYHWNKKDTVRELLMRWPNSTDDAIDIFNLSGVNPQNVYGCFLAPQCRRQQEPRRGRVSSPLLLYGLFLPLKERLEEFATDIVEKGCKCQITVVIYEGGHDKRDSMTTEEYLKKELLSEEEMLEQLKKRKAGRL